MLIRVFTEMWHPSQFLIMEENYLNVLKQTIKELQQAEPPKVGDYVLVESAQSGALGYIGRYGYITEEKANHGLGAECPNGVRVKIDGEVWNIGRDYSTVKVTKQ